MLSKLKEHSYFTDAANVNSPYTRARPRPHVGGSPVLSAIKLVKLSLAVGVLAFGWIAIRSQLGHDTSTVAVNGFMSVLPPLLSGLIAIRYGWLRGVDTAIRKGWLVIGVGCTLYGLSLTVAFIATIFGGENYDLLAASSLATGHGILLSLVIAGTLSWLEGSHNRLYVGLATDLFCIAGLATLGMWAGVLDHASINTLWSAIRTGNAQLLMYPIVDVTLIAVAVSVLSQVRREGRSSASLVALAAVGLLASDAAAMLKANDVLNTYGVELALRNTTSDFALHDLGWTLGILALGIGARIGRQEESERHSPLIERSATWETLWVVIPFASFVGTALLMPLVSHAGVFGRSFGYALLGLSAVRCVSITLTVLSTSRHASIDPLTGALNHSSFQDQLGTLASVSMDLREPLTLLMLDIDDFELLNDGFGYHEGDHFLREIAFVIREQVGSRGAFFRSGGDEFAVILPGIDSATALELAESISESCERIVTPGAIDPSVSMSLATMPTHTFDVNELVRLVEGTLYWAKFNDHSRVTMYDPQVVKILSPEERMNAIEQLAQLRAVLALARALDTRDGYTARHSQNVAKNAIAIADQLGWSTERQELLRIAGLLHDVGKIGVRDTTLRKAGNLTPDEWNEMREHPVMSARVISGVAPEEIIPWVLAHHERIDGRGYPNGLSGEQIPVEARVLAIADSFDAMTASRSYRPGMPPLWAMNEIVDCAGTQFDPEVVRAFLRAFKAGTVVLQDRSKDEANDSPAEIVQDPEFGPDKDVAA